jgi:hypothetical protein
VTAADWGILVPAITAALLALATFLRGEATRAVANDANARSARAMSRALAATSTGESGSGSSGSSPLTAEE